MSDAADVVKALREVSGHLHSKGREMSTLPERRAYQDAAARVDEVIIGPAIQAALDQLDAQVPE